MTTFAIIIKLTEKEVNLLRECCSNRINEKLLSYSQYLTRQEMESTFNLSFNDERRYTASKRLIKVDEVRTSLIQLHFFVYRLRLLKYISI